MEDEEFDLEFQKPEGHPGGISGMGDGDVLEGPAWKQGSDPVSWEKIYLAASSSR